MVSRLAKPQIGHTNSDSREVAFADDSWAVPSLEGLGSIIGRCVSFG